MREKLDATRIAGTLLAVAGVAVVIGLPENAPALLPSALIIAGAFCWALGQVLVRKLGSDSGIGLLKANAIGSVPQLAIAMLVLERGQWSSMQSAGWEQWAMLAFVGIVGFYLAYMCWFTLLKQCRLDEAGPFVLLMPVVGLVTAYFLLGERVSPVQIIGGLVILAGLAVVSGLVIPSRQKGAVTETAPLAVD